MFPVISTDGATFIDDNSLFFTGCSFVALMKDFKILLFGLGTHILIPPFPNLPSVTFYLSQFALKKIVLIFFAAEYNAPLIKKLRKGGS